MLRALHIVFILLSFIGLGQEEKIKKDTSTLLKVQTFETCIVESIKQKNNPQDLDIFDQKRIEKISPTDAGDLLQRSTGVTIKNYGDIGGLKTVSVKGMGAQHNTLVINGQTIQNPQTGLADYGQLQTENIKRIYITNNATNSLSTVSALSAGNAVIVTTEDAYLPKENLEIDVNYKIGSFNLHDFYLSTKVKTSKKSFLALNMKKRIYKGNYHYKLTTPNFSIAGIRSNNNYDSDHLNFNYGLQWGKTRSFKLFVNGSYLDITNQLPGAVIVYNGLNDDVLNTNKLTANLQLSIRKEKTDFSSKNKTDRNHKIYVNYQKDDFQYLNPTYLNNEGKIDNQYLNQTSIIGYLNRFDLKNLKFGFGHEALLNDLTSNRKNFASPVRLTNKTIGQLKYRKDKFTLDTRLTYQYIIEENRLKNKRLTDVQTLLPMLQLSYYINKSFSVVGYAKRSFRLPTFNELYYSQIGNINLSPEKANQFNINIKYKRKALKNTIHLQSNIFVNLIEDKILAIPTANAFVWSMQNVGNVLSSGIDFSGNYTQELSNNLKTTISGNFTYQNVLDKSDVNGITYNNQIAYTPKILANGGLQISYKSFYLFTEYNFIGSRYSLNQNITDNIVSAYGVTNISLANQFKIKDKSSIKIQIGVKNISNHTNHFIRYFVLPGRNYFAKIAYAVN